MIRGKTEGTSSGGADLQLQVCPRELLKRENRTVLNGEWDYEAVRSTGTADPQEERQSPSARSKKICVPFLPGTVRSGVKRRLGWHTCLWYSRKLPQPVRQRENSRILLHFEGVGGAAVVYVNGREVTRHAGDGLPFDADITEYLQKTASDPQNPAEADRDEVYSDRPEQDGKCADGQNPHTADELAVYVQADEVSRALGLPTGIFRTVWMEEVPDAYIRGLDFRPDPEEGFVELTVRADADLAVSIIVHTPEMAVNGDVSRIDEGALMQRVFFSGRSNTVIRMRIPHMHVWSPDAPWLYTCEVRMGQDYVTGYFAFRSMQAARGAAGAQQVILNGEPLPVRSVSEDAGQYEPGGAYQTDQAAAAHLAELKKDGYNAIRPEKRVGPDRLYSLCDRFGMLVWQDFRSGRTSGTGRPFGAAGDLLAGHPSVVEPAVITKAGRKRGKYGG